MGQHGGANERVGLSPQLTRRERQVVERLGRGELDKEIAEALDMSVHTVRSHIRNAMRSSGARSRAHLIGLLSRGRRTNVSG